MHLDLFNYKLLFFVRPGKRFCDIILNNYSTFPGRLSFVLGTQRVVLDNF